MTQTQLSQTGFLRLPEVLKLFPVSKSTWWTGVKSGTYPKPVKLSSNITAWRVDDIRTLINSYGI
ncbi:MAG: transcriptional regulator [Alphaproteobacteria bacterium]|nr:MAG: transcriptional regulator [Alphaproteobacteria bacterium]